jgi:hypothetical protein
MRKEPRTFIFSNDKTRKKKLVVNANQKQTESVFFSIKRPYGEKLDKGASTLVKKKRNRDGVKSN